MHIPLVSCLLGSTLVEQSLLDFGLGASRTCAAKAISARTKCGLRYMSHFFWAACTVLVVTRGSHISKSQYEGPLFVAAAIGVRPVAVCWGPQDNCKRAVTRDTSTVEESAQIRLAAHTLHDTC